MPVAGARNIGGGGVLFSASPATGGEGGEGEQHEEAKRYLGVCLLGSGKPDLGVAGGVGGRGGEVCGGGGVPVAFWGREQADELRRMQEMLVVGLSWLGGGL